MTGSELQGLLKKSHEKARKAVFNEYCNYVFAVTAEKLKGIGNVQDIEECMSDVFSEIFLKLESLSDSEGDIKGFIGTVAKNRAVDFYRKLSAVKRQTVPIENEIQSEEDIQELMEKAETARILREKIKELGRPDSDIIIHRYFFNRSYRDIAVLLSMKESAVQKRCSRAKKKLKKLLEDSGIGEP